LAGETPPYRFTTLPPTSAFLPFKILPLDKLEQGGVVNAAVMAGLSRFASLPFSLIIRFNVLHMIRWVAGSGVGIMLFSGSLVATNSTARFEPPGGKILLLAGSTQEDIQGYMDVTHILPAGLMGYVAIGGEGLISPYSEGSGTQDLPKLAGDYPGAVLQIGLYLVDSCAAIAHGDKDADIDRLGDWSQKTRRPIFLRPGYEFDGPHNHYAPKDYIQAYRRIVDRFRKHGVQNVAYVWHSYASVGSSRIDQWYPGDDYVDWVGISYFNQPQSYMQPVLTFARARGKPVMICEFCPAMIQTKYSNAWNLWFIPFFKFIKDNDIKALCYINHDWYAGLQFKKFHWGDTRLQSNPEILRRWLAETAQDCYQKSDPTLFKQLGFNSD